MVRSLSPLLLSILILTGCGGETEAETEFELATVQASPGQITRVIGATGKIVPRNEIMVGSEVSGRILEVPVDFNSRVKTGQLLAVIDPTNFRNRVQQLEGRIRSARADIEVQQARIRSAEVTLAQAKLNETRRKNLFAKQAVSEAQMETAERDVGVARANLDLTKAQLTSQQASLAQVQAEMDTAKENLARTRISSPIDGVIIDRKIDPGQTVQASFNAPELFTIAADLSEIQVEARIVESDVAGLNPGDKAKFSVDAYPDRTIEGVVEQLRLKSVEQNNIVSYTAVVRAENPDGALMPGMTANLEITTDIRAGVSRLPVTAERFRPSPETRSFMHTPMRIQLGEIVENQVRQFLSPEEQSRYTAQVTLERKIRPVDVWIARTSGASGVDCSWSPP